MRFEKIGLIAGSSKFPIAVAQSAKRQNIKVCAVCLKEEASPGLEAVSDSICWVSVGEIGKAVDFLKKENIRYAVMAGKVRLSHIYDKSIPADGYLKNLLLKAVDKRGDTLLLAVTKFLNRIGIKLLDSAVFLKDDLAKKGLLTKLAPTRQQSEDIEFAKPLVKQVALMRIGQTIVVKDKAVLAVEAMEGTDEAILRGGRIATEGAVVVKMTSPKHDMRFDVPLVGPSTIDTMNKVKAAVLAIEAQKTLLIEKEEFLRKAGTAGICVVAIK